MLPGLQPALESVRADAGARRTAAFLDEARRRAVLERKALQVRCVIDEERLELVAAEQVAKSFAIPEQLVLVSCLPEEVRYFPQGSSSGLALLLRDRRGRERRVAVGAFTGLTRIDLSP